MPCYLPGLCLFPESLGPYQLGFVNLDDLVSWTCIRYGSCYYSTLALPAIPSDNHQVKVWSLRYFLPLDYLFEVVLSMHVDDKAASPPSAYYPLQAFGSDGSW